ncbi:Leucine-rich repeat-containing protein 15 [Collichthys lucidus]|uniref:Leucine-rich repeat-containing protein 15 n=1 Tax=Collichthys lucidus TaxID=240159 RepID=A0A4U5V010_COLLU|nr:Leucine-rich repeat-containing protein 15 [Collichthys lucidus]
MLAALTLASLSLLVWGSNLCPPSCQCLHNLTTVVCQVKGLSRIPELPDGTEKLYVSYNNIQEIPRRGLEKLQDLDLTKNQLNVFLSFTPVWPNMTNLSKLFLRDNGLTSLHPDLSNNKLTNLSEGSLRGLINLSELDLNSNLIDYLPPKVFSSLNRLKILDLYFNRLTSLSLDVFSNLIHLQELQLDSNQISNIPVGVFDSLSKLSELQLANNHILEIHPALFKKLKALQNLNLENNAMKHLPEGVFHKMRALKEIHLNDNHIKSLHPSVFNGLVRVHFLSFSRNRLSSLHPDQFKDLVSLKELHLDENHIGNIPASPVHKSKKAHYTESGQQPYPGAVS